MKTSKIMDAIMWLPGFAPDEDPIAMLGQAGAAIVAPAQQVKVWPKLHASMLDDLRSEASKYEANIKAIQLLKQLQAENRQPNADERSVLNRYTGWGGLPKAFMLDHADWGARAQALKALLSDDEYQSANDSTLNAHFTPLDVIEAMWGMLGKLGFKGGRVLEPAAGLGYFIGAMPTEVAEKSEVTAIELEGQSAGMLKALYAAEGVNVLHQGFEATACPEGFYDLVVGNVPFGNFQVAETRNVPFASFMIHDYFFAKALEVVREGGLVACITSSGTMDKASNNVREYLARRAELVAAVRLPMSTFQAIANTSVTADILIFQKRPTKLDVSKENWMSSKQLDSANPLWDESAQWYERRNALINTYFEKHPEQVLGKIGMTGNGYGKVPCCVGNGDLVEQLRGVTERLPGGIYVERKPVERMTKPSVIRCEKNGLFVLDGTVYEAFGGEATPVKAAAKVLERIKLLCDVRDAARKLIDAQPMTDDDELLNVYRVGLNVAYDGFVSKFGFVSDKLNRRAFNADPDLPLLLSLERWNEETQTAAKSDVFSKRTVGTYRRVERCESTADALVISLIETGRVDEALIAKLAGKPVKDAMTELEDAGAAFLNPANGEWESAEDYLSGAVRTKLSTAKLAGSRFAANIKALEAVQPRDLTPNEIAVRIGATWIPMQVYGKFASEVFELENVDVLFSPTAGAWSVNAPYSAKWSIKCTQEYGTSEKNAVDLFEMALNQQTPTVTVADRSGTRVVDQQATIAAREAQSKIKEAFNEWCWADEARASSLAQEYNVRMNGTVRRQFNGDHLALPGFSMSYSLYKHQRDAIWRIVSSHHNTLLAHVVGAGKTLTMICGGMELRRVGKASKIAYVVPNHMLEQFSAEFLRAYPGAKVLMASKDDLSGDRRRNFLARIATGDWDGIVMTHSTFERIKVSDEFLKSSIEAEISEIMLAIRDSKDGSDTRIVKELVRAKKQWEAKLAKLSSTSRKDDMLRFEQLGIDFLMVDEAHYFKNLYRHTKMTRIAGLPNSNSERSFDMLIKTQLVTEERRKKGLSGGIVFATGTPVSNSMAELWVMQKFLQPLTLQLMGMGNFDGWAGTYGESVTALELSPDGSTYRMNQRFAKFVNIPELLAVFCDVADIRTADMLDLPVPAAKRFTVVAKPSDDLKEYIATLVKRAEKIRNGAVTPSEDNMLAVTGDGRRVALDIRLVEPMHQEEAGSKVLLCAEKVIEVWQRTAAERSTQLVFCDMSTPRTDGVFDAYNGLREKLVAGGIPAEEIAFIHDAATDAAKEKLFAAVRAGQIRVLLGSTAKMGVGTNVQQRLIALHHLDAPWRPSDVEQREGRIIRQGCTNAEVEIYRYVTEASFDCYLWQILESKARFVAQLMSGDTELRSAEDIELACLSYAEVKALASGNPLVLEKAAVDAELAKLTVLKSAWQTQQWSNKCALSYLPKEIKSAQERIKLIEQDVARSTLISGQDAEIIIAGKKYTDEKKAQKAITVEVSTLKHKQERVIGKFAGFDLIAYRGEMAWSVPELALRGHREYQIGDCKKSGMVGKLIECVEGLGKLIARHSADIAHKEKQILDIQRHKQDAFEKEDRLTWLAQRQREIESMFELNQGVNMDVDSAELAEAA